MKPSKPKPLLNDKQKRFALEFLTDLNATQAAIRAGYSAKTAKEQGYALLTNPHIHAMVQEGKAKRAERVEISQDWILTKLRENAERAMQAAEVKDSEGNGLGIWKYDGGVANRALELLGKHNGMFVDKQEIKHEMAVSQLSDAELAEKIAGLVKMVVGT